MARRARNEGSIYYWDLKKLWVAKISLPDCKSRTKYGKTQKEVKTGYRSNRPAVGIGLNLVHRVLTGASLSHSWLYLVGPLLGAALASAVFRLQDTETA